MRATTTLLALALAAALQPAVAGTVTLGFEDLTSNGKLTDRYGALGATFTGDAWGVVSGTPPCTGFTSFTHTNGCGALMLAADPTATPTSATQSFVMSLVGGFVTEFDFAYSARASSSVRIDIYDGLNGTGNILKTLTSFSTSNCNSSTIRFCDWFNGSIVFDGTALSFKVSGVDQRLLMDDLKFITPAAASNNLPEPGSLVLAFSALGALGWARKRYTQA